MPVPISNVTRRQVYAPSGTGGEGPYAFTFEILANTDIAVYKDDTLLTLTTHYTVTIASNGTGSVTITATGLALSPTSPTQYAIVGNRTISRSTDFTTGGDFFANTLNDELDQQTIFAQQNAEGIVRSLQAPQTDPTTINMILPRSTVRASKVLAFDSSGNPTATEFIGSNRGNWATSTIYYVRDIVKDTSNSNIYNCLTQHTSTGSQPISSNADVAKWSLLVDAAAAGASATAAAASASAAATSASGASTSATNASNSATTATTQASNASTSATSASGSASTATTQATAAGTSATSAAASATSATASATTATTQATTATTQATNASTSATNAATSATTATTQATTATTQATNAATSASAASTSASNAATSASNASTSATAAAASAAAAAASFDAFDDIYLGAKSSNPTVDNDGNALTTGDQYFNTVSNELRVWNGSTWQAASTVGGTVTSLTVTGVASFADGSAAAPSITNDGDTNTGIFFPAADTIAFAEGGAEAMRIDSSGNVGIGNTTPSSYNAVAENLVIGTSGSNGLTIVSGTTNDGSIHFADGTSGADADRGQIWYSHAGNYMVFGTDATERMRISSSGNVAIGVTPSAWSGYRALQIGGTTSLWSSTSGNASSFYTNNGYFNGTNRIYLTTGFATEYIQGAGQHIWYNAPSGTAGNAITFTQAMTLDASGNLGIGTSSPAGLLDVDKNQNTSTSLRVGNSNAGSSAQSRLLLISDGGNIQVKAMSTTNTTYGAGDVGVINCDNMSGGLRFSHNDTVGMTLDSSNNFLVGTTSTSLSSGVGFKFTSSSTAPNVGQVVNTSGSTNTYHYYNDNATNGGYRFYVNVNGGIYNFSGNNSNLSDERTKTNITLADNYLDKICAIPVKTFNYKDEPSGEQKTLGLIAQDVQRIAPEFVNSDGKWEVPEGESPLLSIYSTDMMFALMKSIQELKAINDTQAETINALTARIVALESK